MNVYLISGLGVDHRVFQKLELPPFCTAHPVAWILPLRREPVGSYARRLAAVIDTSEPFVLIGMSFGGMMAAEMNRFLRPLATIIISSAPTRHHLPPYFRLGGWLGLHRMVPSFFYKWPNPLLYWLFGIRTREEKALFRALITDADIRIVRWSVNAVVNWKNMEAPPNLVHIHGTADRLLPLRWARPSVALPGGGHLMVFSRAAEVSEIINKIIMGL